MSGTLGRLTYTLDVDQAAFDQKLASSEGQAKHMADAVMSAGSKLQGAFKPAEAGLTSLEQRFQQLSALHLTPQIQVNTAVAQDQIAQLQSILGKVGDYKTLLKVNAETQTAYRDLTQLQTFLGRLGDHPAVVEVKANVDAAVRDLEHLLGVVHQVDDASAHVSVSAGGLSGALGSIGQGALSMASGIGIANAATGLLSGAFSFLENAAIGTNASLETATLQFTTLMGSADEASKHVRDLFDFAKATPFATGPVIEASRQLEAFGGKALDTKANLTLLGDAAAATNANISEVAFWMGRAYAAIQGGKPFGEAALRLQELAILSPQAAQGIADLQAKGASADTVWGALTSSFTRFSGAMDKQAGTWKGLTSTVSDFLNLTAANVLQPFFLEAEGALKGFLDQVGTADFTAKMEEWRLKAQDMAKAVHDFAVNDGPALVKDAQDIATSLGQIAAAGIPVIETLIKIKHARDDLDPSNWLPGGVLARAADAAKLGVGGDPIGEIKAIGQLADALTAGGVAFGVYQKAHDAFIQAHQGDSKYLGNFILLEHDANVAATDASAAQDKQTGAVDRFSGGLTNAIALMDRYVVAQQKMTTPEPTREGQLNVPTVQPYGPTAGGTGFNKQLADQSAAAKAAALANQANTAALHEEARALAEAGKAAVDSASNAAQLSFAIHQVAQEQNQLASAYQISLGIQKTYSAQESEYNGQVKAITDAQGVLKDQLDRGAISQDAYNTKTDEYSAALVRLQGGVEDATLTTADYAVANSKLMIAQDTLSATQPQLVQGSKEFTQALKDAFITAGGTAEQFDALAQSGANMGDPLMGVQQVIAGPDGLIPAINNLVTQLGILNGTSAKPTVSLDTGTFDTKTGELIPTLDGLDKREVKVHVTADNSDALTKTQEAEAALGNLTNGTSALAAPGHAGFIGSVGGNAAWNTSIGADIGGVTTAVDTAGGIVHHFVGDKYEARITADGQGVKGAVDVAQSQVDILVGGSYSVTIDANIGPALEQLGILGQHLPSSPAETGPLSIVPNWAYLTDGMAGDVGPGVAGGAQLIAGYFPAGPTTGPTHGALAGGVDWSFIFASIDKTAQDAGKQLEAAFTSTLGNLSDIASGATGKKLQDELTNLIDLKAIAIETNAGAAVVAEYDKQIAAKQAEINAIGVVMGTDIVQGIKSTIDAANILQGIEASVGKFNIGDIASGSALSQLQQQLSALQSTRAAVAELGLPQAVLDNIDAQIKQVEADIATVTELAGTSAAAIVKSQQDATVAFTASLGILSSGDPFKAAQDQLAKLHDLQTQVEEAILNPNIPPEVLAAFEQQAQQAADEYRAMQATLKSALINGLIDPATLQAMAQAGGDAFAAFYDGIFGAGALEKLQAAWQQAAAIPLDELAKVLPSLADHGQALIDTLTGQVEDGSRSLADAMQAISLIAGQTWHDTDGTIHHGTEIAIAELKKLEQELKVKLAEALVSGADPKQFEDNIALIEQLLADVSASVDTTAEAFHNAKQSVADFLNVFPRGGGKSIILNGQSFTGGGKGGLLSPVAPAIVDLDALLKLFQSAPDTIAQSMGSIVDSITAGSLSYKDALSLLTHATTSQVGQIVDSLHSLEGQLEGQLAQAILDGTDPKKIKGLQAHLAEVEKLLAGVTGATGITGGSLNDIVSGLAGFHTTADQLAQLIQDQALTTFGPANFSQMTDPKAITDAITAALGGTFADEQLALLKNIFTNPDLYPPALVDYIEKGLGKSLGTLDVSLSTQLGEVNKLLADAGLKQLTPEEWKKMNETWQDKMLDTGSATIDSLGKVADGQADIGGRVSDGAELVRGQVDRAGSAIIDTLKDQFKHLISAESAIAAGNDPNAFNPFPPGGGGLKKGVLPDPGIADLSSSSTPNVDTGTMSTLGDNEGLAASIGRHVVGALLLAPEAPIMLDDQKIGQVTAQNFFKQQRQYATLISPIGRR